MTETNQSQDVQTSAVDEPVARLLAQITADAPQLQGLVIGFVRKDGNAAVRYTPMSTAMLSHLSRIFDLKIDREYMGSMFPPATHGARAPSTNSPVSKGVAQASPASRLVEREKPSNKVKQAVKKAAKGTP